jgi:hypothetical protein
VWAHDNAVDSATLVAHEPAQLAVHGTQGLAIEQAAGEPGLVARNHHRVAGAAQASDCGDTARQRQPFIGRLYEAGGILVDYAITIEAALAISIATFS